MRILPTALALLATMLGATLQSPPGRPPVAPPVERSIEWVDLARVVDGDTIHVRRAGRLEKLRLLSVDTEERLGKGHSASATKPQTVFGEECAIWAEKLFADLPRAEGKPARVGLRFPGGLERRDAYGRLLCHVLLPDGTDYNLLLVRTGRSPYFNKYGDDEIAHEEFVDAQREAREAKLGIWDPRTNRATTPGAPSATRPYPELLAWWDARARAVEAWRDRLARAPDEVADAEDPESLERAACSGREVDVFGEVGRIFDERDGSRTVLFRASDGDRALRVRIPLASREAHEALDLRRRTREFRQNYVWVRGRVEAGDRGFSMRSEGPDRWRAAGPEPALPPPR